MYNATAYTFISLIQRKEKNKEISLNQRNFFFSVSHASQFNQLFIAVFHKSYLYFFDYCILGGACIWRYFFYLKPEINS